MEAQLIEDGTYPGAEGIFAEIERAGEVGAELRGAGERDALSLVADYSPAQPRDPHGKWTAEGAEPSHPAQRSGIRAGQDSRSGCLSSYVDPEQRVRPDRSLRTIRTLVDETPSSLGYEAGCDLLGGPRYCPRSISKIAGVAAEGLLISMPLQTAVVPSRSRCDLHCSGGICRY